ncbi:MAG TPA: Ig-like domain-containing protein [Anaeromyxobacteraceae bacterium]|nr:Ig-like domain-containing protein [Anaeromyxobacteraceae bacterium]
MKNVRLVAALAATLGAVSAQAALERVGPQNPDPSVGNYPAWYQDQTGLALEFCNPLNQAEVDGGWCLLLPGDVNIPEVFPTNFFDEHFYFAAGANLTANVGNKASLVIAVEAAFAGGPAAVGDQITFGRIRVRLNTAPVTGTYRFIHPYGEEIFQDVQAGARIFFTDDVGINCPPGGPFDCALATRIGPFLLPSAIPGGPEQAAIPGPFPGKLYIADPARLGPVTGSALPDFVDSTGATRNHNIFRIEGPPGSNLGGVGQDWIETVDFSLMGRAFTGTIPGRVTVDRASYERTGSSQKIDVFATGLPTTLGRLPAQPRPAAVLPQLSFFEAACTRTAAGGLGAPAGAVERQMFNASSSFWGQSSPAALPAEVCVKDAAARDATGAIVPAFFAKPLADEVTITEATYDPSQQMLSVRATSSDLLAPPILTVAGFGEIPAGSDQVAFSPLAAPGAKVRVISSAGGAAELATKVGFVTNVPPAGPVAVNDAFTFNEDSGPQTLDLLGNDTGAAGGVVAVLAQPRLGTLSAPGADGRVIYTPNANAFGADGFTYSVTVGGVTSNIANVSLSLTPANDAPVAVNDGPFTVVVNSPALLPSLIANDTDLDGNADVVGIRDVSAVTPAGATVTVTAGGITVLASAPGTYTFTYRAVDASGTPSANAATVTVVAIASDTVGITQAQFRTGQARWTVIGTDSAPNQVITITYADGAAAGRVIGTAQGDATGAWTLDIRGVTGALNPTTLNPRPTQVRATSALGGTRTQVITIRN